jgi:hypothetical protein
VSTASSYGVSAGAAVLGGLSIASSAVLQQRAASRAQRGALLRRLIVQLLHNRGWLLGLGLSILSYGFQALALACGPLTLVQPLAVSELLFAVPVSVRLRGLRLACASGSPPAPWWPG